MTQPKLKPAKKRAAAKSKAASTSGAASAASDEVAEQPTAKTVEFRGRTLHLPDQMPATLAFDLVDIETSGANGIPLLRLVKSLLGAEQFLFVRNQMQSDDDVGDVVDGLLKDVFEQYGLSLGKP